MNQEDYIKQLEASNQLLQQKLEETTVKLEESSIRNEALMVRPGRIWSLHGYKGIKSAKEYEAYKSALYPTNCQYPDYTYWTLATSTHMSNKRDSDFCRHFIQQIRRYVGIAPVSTNCREDWLDDKIMDMPILILFWYRVPAWRMRSEMLRKTYIIERDNPQIYVYNERGRTPNVRGPRVIPSIRIQ